MGWLYGGKSVQLQVVKTGGRELCQVTIYVGWRTQMQDQWRLMKARRYEHELRAREEDLCMMEEH
jgi:hypothetical protein